MSKSHARNQNKGQNPGENNASDTTQGLDANQSAQSMSAGADDTTVNQNKSGDASGSYDEEGVHKSSVEIEANDPASGNENSAVFALDTQSIKKNLNIVKDKAQNLLNTGKEQISSRYSSLSDDVKLRSMFVDDKVKANPYVWALGALGAGFVLGRVLSGKGKQDFDFVKSSVGKVSDKVSGIDIASIASLVGVNLGGKEAPASSSSKSSKAKTGYNESQARKIG